MPCQAHLACALELEQRGEIILDMDGIKIDSVDDLPRVREKMATMKSGT